MATPLILGPNGTPVGALTGVDNFIFKQGSFGATLSANALTASRSLTLPNRSGTLATIDQVPTEARLNEIAMIGTPSHQTSTANAPATIAIATPGAGLSHQLNNLTFSYDKPPTGGLITVSSGATIYYRQAIVTAGVGPVVPGIKLPANTAIDITLSAGGVGVIGYVSASLSVV